MARTMKRSEVYTEAARRIERDQDQYSCIAIANAAHGENRDLCCDEYAESQDYVQVFADTSDRLNELFSRENSQSQNIRILALCFMSAIAADDEGHGKRSGQAVRITRRPNERKG